MGQVERSMCCASGSQVFTNAETTALAEAAELSQQAGYPQKEMPYSWGHLMDHIFKVGPAKMEMTPAPWSSGGTNGGREGGRCGASIGKSGGDVTLGGGGGSSYASGTSSSLLSGSGINAGNNADPNYIAGKGKGSSGFKATSGTLDMVHISW